ncbi:MAG: 6,7-dimethyl-8-ribityllumazine synthase [Verrucomicrobia bacterium]|nr:MAG: 6,7-dimethyl-8-ribityllumazine synthase [Verrucomicrobiota bacterium]
MLKPLKPGTSRASGRTFAIVAAKYNGRYVDAMLRAAKSELIRAGAKEVKVVRVPGSFEIPAVAAKLAQSHLPPLSAVICLGVIFQGETSHAQHVGWGVTHALAQIQLQHKIPVVHGVFVFEKEEQARARCLGNKHNRGIEAARTALEMAQVMEEF